MGSDQERAARFWDEQQQPDLERDGIPPDALERMRRDYIDGVVRNDAAVRQLREMYPDRR